MQDRLIDPKRSSRTQDESLIPLINIVFLLLIFFMVAGQITQQQEAAITPPKSSSSLELKSALINLSLTSKGELRLEGQTIKPEDLKQQLPTLSTTAEDLRVSLRADSASSAADLDRVLKALQELGVSAVSLHTQYIGSL
ncbi:biopolymer transporter ExbD [Parahaliea sp. F7430]|uniref:Biopolymer transporter ExbD n=1 Tax=Sediminihaliea albiluteola TaxID=2758564 RepID=A0A7W2YIP7_9GAMM|nr:biopolymer transporter ExbD [Sediminihaliea albiluteola]MBA6411739.1 biopolymer transporter ExbD [Sediminihaliea albiluteola]